MPSHACIDPHDQYAQAEVLVAFETTAGVVRLVSAHDASDDDILPDLDDIQRRALERRKPPHSPVSLGRRLEPILRR